MTRIKWSATELGCAAFAAAAPRTPATESVSPLRSRTAVTTGRLIDAVTTGHCIDLYLRI